MNITKPTEEELLETQEHYRLLTEYAADMISRYTPDGIFLYVSKSCQTFFFPVPDTILLFF